MLVMRTVPLAVIMAVYLNWATKEPVAGGEEISEGQKRQKVSEIADCKELSGAQNPNTGDCTSDVEQKSSRWARKKNWLLRGAKGVQSPNTRDWEERRRKEVEQLDSQKETGKLSKTEKEVG